MNRGMNGGSILMSATNINNLNPALENNFYCANDVDVSDFVFGRSILNDSWIHP